MNFEPSPTASAWTQQMEAFLGRFVLPHNGAWHRCASQGVYPPFMEDLKALARAEGLWNLCLPGLREDEPGTRLNNLDYAPLAEAMGRLPWSAEVFNCSAPNSGNMDLLQRHASPAQRQQWLLAAAAGR